MISYILINVFLLNKIFLNLLINDQAKVNSFNFNRS